jgi:hypothetical protein
MTCSINIRSDDYGDYEKYEDKYEYDDINDDGDDDDNNDVGDYDIFYESNDYASRLILSFILIQL